MKLLQLCVLAVLQTFAVSVLSQDESSRDLVPELIYEPISKRANVTSEIKEKSPWAVVARLGEMMPQGTDSAPTMSFAAEYALPWTFYVGAEAGYATWKTTFVSATSPKLKAEDKDAGHATLYVAYDALHGLAYITEGLTLPWRFTLQGNIGKSIIDGRQARYMSGSLAWKVQYQDMHAGFEWRKFDINNRELSATSSDEGTQWAVVIGTSF